MWQYRRPLPYPGLEADLAPYGVTVAQCLLMSQIDQDTEVGVCYSLEHLVVHTYRMTQYHYKSHCEDFLEAIDALLERGLLQEIAPDQAEEWGAAQTAEGIPAGQGVAYHFGSVFFTESGWELYSRISGEVFDGVRMCQRHDPAEQVVVFISESEEAIREAADRQARFALSPFPSSRSTEDHPIDATLKRVLGPTKIGPWRLSPFEIVPMGYRIVLEYG